MKGEREREKWREQSRQSVNIIFVLTQHATIHSIKLEHLRRMGACVRSTCSTACSVARS